jgi:hypothetical protein
MVMLGWLSWPSAAALADGGVRISQVQTGSSASASEEFVELHNIGAAAAPVAGWSLQYHSAGGDCAKSWSKKVDLAGSIPAGGYFLLAAKDYLATADGRFSAGLASAGGSVRIADASGNEVDSLAWGTGTCGHGAPAKAPAAGQSLERQSDTGVNAADFVIQTSPTALSASSLTPTPSSQPSAAEDTQAAVTVVSLELSELLVDPAAPQTDAADEFIEIHNTGSQTANLGGFKLKTANDSFTFTDQSVTAGGYTVVKSDVSKLALTNTGGQLQLLGPDGQVIDSTEWDEATPGAAWAVVSNVWQWTQQPTPAAPNVSVPLPVAPTDVATNPIPSAASAASNTLYPPIEITELLPDPAAPQTDAADEFIELHNPNAFAVDLTGYQLRTGKTLGDSYSLPAGTIEPDGYLAFKSAQTHLGLANDGSSVALFDPLGVQMGATVTYPVAKPGESYVKVNGAWAWSISVTPATANVLIAPAVAAAKTTAKAVAAKTATKTAAKATAKTTSAKSSKTPAVKTTATKSSAQSSGTLPSPGLGWLLFVLVGLTIGYVVYEFRHDVIGWYQRYVRPVKLNGGEEEIIENSHA